jgi:hypothetical protein
MQPRDCGARLAVRLYWMGRNGWEYGQLASRSLIRGEFEFIIMV